MKQPCKNNFDTHGDVPMTNVRGISYVLNEKNKN